jgi:hypothetical protein
MLVRSQHEPQLGKFHTTPSAPPIKWKEGISPNVGNRAASPFRPSEHNTVERAALVVICDVVLRVRVDDGVLGSVFLLFSGLTVSCRAA